MINKSGKMSDKLKEKEKEEKTDDEEKETKLEKTKDDDIEKVDKKFLDKAKDSRDMIDKKLRTFEDKFDEITENSVEEKKEGEKETLEVIDGKIIKAKEEYLDVSKKVEDKQSYLDALEQTINALEERYVRKNEEINTLEDGLNITKESMENLEEEYKELLKNNEQLVKTYENRQVDVIVLTDSIKEKVARQDELRSEISKFNQKIGENKNDIEVLADEAAALEMKIKSQRAENETLKVSIGKNRFELDHSNSEIEAKEEEKKLLSDQIQKKEFRLKDIEQKLIDYNEGFPELEKQKATYDELLIKYKMQLTEKQQDMIDIESRIQELTDTVDSLQEQIDSKESLIDVNEKRIEDMKKEIEISNNDHKERQDRIGALTEKHDHLNEEYDKLLKAKEVIDTSINDSRTIFQKLKTQLDSQEKEIRNKESRIHRLEMLSLIYRASKFFGGILICLGIVFLIWGIGSLTFIDLGDANIPVLSGLMILGAIFAIISGIFHLEKS